MGWFAAPLFVVAVLAALCDRHTRADRSYYPMQRVMWRTVAAVYMGSAVEALFDAPPAPAVRAAFAAAMIAATAYSLWFIRRRNRLPRFLALSVGGEVIVRPVAELEAKADEVESWAAHGAMPPERAARLAAALDRWRAHEAWRATLADQTARRRRERGAR